MAVLRGRNPLKERTHVLKPDRENPASEQIRWIYRTLPYDTYVRTQDGLVEFKGNPTATDTRTSISTGSQEKEALLAGIVRVENYFDEDGQQRHWPVGKGANVYAERMDFLSTMHPDWRRELFQVILGDTEPTKEDEADLRFRGVDQPQLEGHVPDVGERVPAAVPDAQPSPA